MSSKSKKNQPRKGKSRSSAPTKQDLERELERQALAAGDGEGSSRHDDDDEFIRAPKESSKLRFVVLIALLVFLLVVFMIPGALFGTARGSRDDEGFRWDHPSAGTVQMARTDFVLKKRALDQALNIDPFMRLALGLEMQGTPSDQEIARILVLDGLAEEAGIVISVDDLREHLTQLVQQRFGGDFNLYQTTLQRFGGAAVVESNLSQLLRVRRYLDLLGHVASIASPAEIDELWNEDHVEYAFDFAEVDVNGVREEAAGLVPSDEELGAWFDALSEPERFRFQTQEKRKTQFAVYRVGATAEALVAAFPDGESTTPEEKAREYYDRVFFQRFRRPKDDAASEDPEGEEAPAEPPSEYLSFDEVADVAQAEAPIYRALGAWIEDMELRRSAGEEVDMAAEAAQYGLEVETTDALTREELIAREGLGGPNLAIMAFQTVEGALAPNVQILEDGFCVLRVAEVAEPAIPPLAEIRDEVQEQWIDEKVQELTLERLRELRAGFPEYVPEPDPDEEELGLENLESEDRRTASQEAFTAALSAAGYEAQARDWRDKSAPPPATAQSSQDRFFTTHREFYLLDVGEVSEPLLDSAGEKAYLVRLADTREVPMERMSASDYDRYKRQSAMGASQTLKDQLSYDFLSDRYAAWLWSDDFVDEDELDEFEDLE